MRRIDLKRIQTAHFSTMRAINRQIVLNYVRDRGPISRAEIARQTALQRSTISEIVDSLLGEDLIEEVGAGRSTGGRCPTLLALRTSGAAAVGIDIAPTRTTVAASNLAGRVLEQEEFETDHDFERTITLAVDAACRLVERSTGKVEGIGVSLPGLVDPSTGRLLYVPYFKWSDLDVGPRIAAATGLEVTIDNDANAAALAELWFGHSEVSEARDFIMVFIAEGVGTGIIFDRQIYRGEGGAAGEFGHMIIGERAPVPCSCGSYDCWEAFASGRAAVARYARLAGAGGLSRQMSFAQLIDRALAGEESARAALLETARYLGIGISNLIIGFSPQIVVVGGAITRAWDLVSDLFSETVKRSIRRDLPTARITRSTIGDRASLMGALSLVLANKFASVEAL
ncbi:MAG: ROK family transcriptional regulator [Acidobacteriota bacterium]|nr:ROK family transcriptional regulator [Acidobacteriota bacterium]MDQ5836274.1 ROK family transcriptional regulator [Acidobacteriota bacterium]